MKKETRLMAIPCLVVCALAFVDVDYNNLSALNLISMVCAACTAALIGIILLKHRKEH